MQIRESQIEDILVHSPALAKKVLRLKDEPRLISRQMSIPSGRLDLLYGYNAKLLLIELKSIAFNRKFLEQILNYKSDLENFQTNGHLLNGLIEPYLICTYFSEDQRTLAKERGVTCIDYRPEIILQDFYNNFKPVAFFAKIKPIDIGIWNIHLVNNILYRLDEINSVSRLHQSIKGSSKTLYNKIRFAHELRLIKWQPNNDRIILSDLGKNYVNFKDPITDKTISQLQAKLLCDFVMKNPFESSVILGIASVVESIFALAKNRHPVLMNDLLAYFCYHAGKYFDWKTEKAKYNATRMYSNYAVDLGLIGKSGEELFLTPEGFRFTIQMQLHKSLKMVESLTF